MGRGSSRRSRSAPTRWSSSTAARAGRSSRPHCATPRDRLDVVLDPLWGEPALAALDAGSVGVRLVNFGQVAGPAAEVASAALLRRNATIRGISTALDAPAVRARAEALEHARAGRLAVGHHTFAFDEVDRAWERLQRPEGRKALVSLQRVSAGVPSRF